MTNFEEACKMSAEKWADSLPSEIEVHNLAKSFLL